MVTLYCEIILIGRFAVLNFQKCQEISQKAHKLLQTITYDQTSLSL